MRRKNKYIDTDIDGSQYWLTPHGDIVDERGRQYTISEEDAIKASYGLGGGHLEYCHETFEGSY